MQIGLGILTRAYLTAKADENLILAAFGHEQEPTGNRAKILKSFSSTI